MVNQESPTIPNVGLVTDIDENYYYVWSFELGNEEHRFLRSNFKLNLEYGDVVEFIKSKHSPNEDILEKSETNQRQGEQLERIVTPHKNVKWKVKTQLTFAPPNYKQYKDLIDAISPQRQCYLAFSENFGSIAVFNKDLDFELDQVYEAFISRIPREHNNLVNELRTLFCIVNKNDFVKVDKSSNENAQSLLQIAPWNSPRVRHFDDFDDFGLGAPSQQQIVEDDDFGLGNNMPKQNNKNTLPNAQLEASSIRQAFAQQSSTLRDDPDFDVSGWNRNEPPVRRSNLPQYPNITNQQMQNQSQNDSGFNGLNHLAADRNRLPQQRNVTPQQTYGIQQGCSTQKHNSADADEPHQGIIVRVDKEFCIIWNKTQGFVRAQNYNETLKDYFPLCTFVLFRAFEEVSNVGGGIVCRYTAYSMTMMDAPRLASVVNTSDFNTLRVQAYLDDVRFHDNEFHVATDEFFGPVLFSAKDTWLYEKLRNGEQTEVYVVFSLDYHISKWVAVTVNMGDEHEEIWRKVRGLPTKFDDLVEALQNRLGPYTREPQWSEDLHIGLVSGHFMPPVNWTGIKRNEQEGTIDDVLGVTVSFEGEGPEQIAVIATSIGLARQPKRTLKLGTWLRMCLKAENCDDILVSIGYRKNVMMSTEHSYVVIASKKIEPPMSTRVLRMASGVQKLLLCGNVTRDANNSLENNYLGRIEDEKGLVPQQQSRYGFLVEIGIGRKEAPDRKFYWKLVKYHGLAHPDVLTVPLETSIYSVERGETCGDVHTVLVDQNYTIGMPPLQPPEIPREQPSTSRAAIPQQADYFNQPGNRQQPLAPRSMFSQLASTIGPAKPETSKSCDSSHFPSVGRTIATGLSPMAAPLASSLAPIKGDSLHDQETRITNVLSSYRPAPGASQKSQIGLVVRKTNDFALIYTGGVLSTLGLAIPGTFDTLELSREDFEKFELGTWVSAHFVPVADPFAHYKYMCFFNKHKSEAMLETRILRDFMQVKVLCDFTKENIRQCELNSYKYYLVTALGKVLLDEGDANKNDYLGKSLSLWVTHTQEKFGCYWQLMLNTNFLRDSNSQIVASDIGFDVLSMTNVQNGDLARGFDTIRTHLLEQSGDSFGLDHGPREFPSTMPTSSQLQVTSRGYESGSSSSSSPIDLPNEISVGIVNPNIVGFEEAVNETEHRQRMPMNRRLLGEYTEFLYGGSFVDDPQDGYFSDNSERYTEYTVRSASSRPNNVQSRSPTPDLLSRYGIYRRSPSPTGRDGPTDDWDADWPDGYTPDYTPDDEWGSGYTPDCPWPVADYCGPPPVADCDPPTMIDWDAPGCSLTANGRDAPECSWAHRELPSRDQYQNPSMHQNVIVDLSDSNDPDLIRL